MRAFALRSLPKASIIACAFCAFRFARSGIQTARRETRAVIREIEAEDATHAH